MFEELAKIPIFRSKLVFWLLKNVVLSLRIVPLTFYIFKPCKNSIFGRFRESRDDSRVLLFFSRKNRPSGPFDRMTRSSDRLIPSIGRVAFPIRPIGNAIRPIGPSLKILNFKLIVGHPIDWYGHSADPVGRSADRYYYPTECFISSGRLNRPFARLTSPFDNQHLETFWNLLFPSGRLAMPFDRSGIPSDRSEIPFDRTNISFDRLIV